ncbi:MAG TPA: hypothetical protein VNZ22_10030, partial [Bacillota bacterium]|nr:hypothetical protein [Bacillota bacterium]
MLVLLTALLYLNQVGLPGFVKKPLLEKLRARGIDLQFSRLRLRWYQGVVAENVRFGHADDPLSPQLTLKEVQVRLNARALARFQLQVDSLALHQGRLVWPLTETNPGPRQLSLENIQTELRLLPDDQWALDHFTAGFAGANIRLSGTITNASAVREWKLPHQEPAPPGVLPNRLRRLADTLERIHFGAPPELTLDIQGDARDLQSFAIRIRLSAPNAETPWGAVSRGRFTARLLPAASNEVSRAELNLEAADAQTRWASITNLHLGIQLVSVAGQANLVSGNLTLSAQQAHTPWGGGSNAHFTAQWVHAITNPIPLSGQARLQCEQAHTQWGSAGQFHFFGHLNTPTVTRPAPAPDPGWGWWTNLQPYLLDWECHLTDIQTTQLQARALTCSGSWQAPELVISNLQARLSTGQFQAHAGLDVATRALEVSLASDLDPHQIAPLLTEEGRHLLEQLSWEQPPQVQGELALVLPAWTNREPDWRAEVQPTLRLQGEVHLEHGGAYRQVSIASAHTHFLYSNLCWHLPDLKVTRPEGRLEAEHRANDRTKDFYWRLHSTIDPQVLSPILEAGAQRVLDLFTFAQPPVLDGEVWGRYHDPERIGFSSRVALTNLTFRGETVSGLQATLNYTNRLLQVLEPRLQRDTQHVSAAG